MAKKKKPKPKRAAQLPALPRQVEAPPANEQLAELRQITDREARIEQVVNWMVAGHTPREIADTIRAAWPREPVEALELDALQQITAAGQLEPDIVKGFCTLGFRTIYARCFALADYAGAQSALKNLAALHGEL